MKLAAASILASLALTASGAAADEPDDDRAATAVLAGGGLIFASGVVGLGIAGADAHRDAKNDGLFGAQLGMMAAPILAHAIEGEWTRGLWFAIPGAVASAGTAILATTTPDFVAHAAPAIQYGLALALTVSIIGGTVGVVDAAFADGRRARTSTAKLSLVPLFGGGTTGAILTGSL